jgi:hypothetical protein
MLTVDGTIATPYPASAKSMRVGAANIEDQFRSALALLDGLGVIDKAAEKILKDGIDFQMSRFLTSLLKTENGITAGKDPASKDAAQGAGRHALKPMCTIIRQVFEESLGSWKASFV